MRRRDLAIHVDRAVQELRERHALVQRPLRDLPLERREVSRVRTRRLPEDLGKIGARDGHDFRAAPGVAKGLGLHVRGAVAPARIEIHIRRAVVAGLGGLAPVAAAR
ncbi:MAG TPA: hypothetical protein PLK52_12385, partial [Usitatibacteraceae bacterium]|nr:hypothetical protein [Usitatibacteraceae bacterium]